MHTDPRSVATGAHTLGAEESRPAPAAAFQPVASAAGTTTATSDRDSGRVSVASSAPERESPSPTLVTGHPVHLSAAAFQSAASAAPFSLSGRDSGTGSQRPEGSERESPSPTLYASEHEHAADPGDLSAYDIAINQQPNPELLHRGVKQRTAEHLVDIAEVINTVCEETYTLETVEGLMPDKEIVNEKVRESLRDKVLATMEFKGFFTEKFTLTPQSAPVWVVGIIALINNELLETIFDKSRHSRFIAKEVITKVIPLIETELLERNKQAVLNESLLETSRLSQNTAIRAIPALLRECTRLTLNDKDSFTICGAVSTTQQPRKADEETEGYFISKQQLGRFVKQETSRSQAGSQAGSEASFRQ